VLIITRRAGERIMLGDDTRIEIMEIVGSSVRVGIEAPKSIPVYREEIWTAVKEENRAAASPDTKLPRTDASARAGADRPKPGARDEPAGPTASARPAARA
jgi:carbon storage regulator